eukprot:jgi/Bigna1/136148/aug1.32_g10856
MEMDPLSNELDLPRALRQLEDIERAVRRVATSLLEFEYKTKEANVCIGDEVCVFVAAVINMFDLPDKAHCRASCKTHQSVTDVARMFWRVVKSSGEGSEDDDRMSLQQYSDAHIRMNKALREDFEMKKAEDLAQTDFVRDSGGRGKSGKLTMQQYVAGIKELADLWTLDITPEAYTSFLRKLLMRISKVDEDGVRKLKAVDEVQILTSVDLSDMDDDGNDLEKDGGGNDPREDGLNSGDDTHDGGGGGGGGCGGDEPYSKQATADSLDPSSSTLFSLKDDNHNNQNKQNNQSNDGNAQGREDATVSEDNKRKGGRKWSPKNKSTRSRGFLSSYKPVVGDKFPQPPRAEKVAGTTQEVLQNFVGAAKTAGKTGSQAFSRAVRVMRYVVKTAAPAMSKILNRIHSRPNSQYQKQQQNQEHGGISSYLAGDVESKSKVKDDYSNTKTTDEQRCGQEPSATDNYKYMPEPASKKKESSDMQERQHAKHTKSLTPDLTKKLTRFRALADKMLVIGREKSILGETFHSLVHSSLSDDEIRHLAKKHLDGDGDGFAGLGRELSIVQLGTCLLKGKRTSSGEFLLDRDLARQHHQQRQQFARIVNIANSLNATAAAEKGKHRPNARFHRRSVEFEVTGVAKRTYVTLDSVDELFPGRREKLSRAPNRSYFRTMPLNMFHSDSNGDDSSKLLARNLQLRNSSSSKQLPLPPSTLLRSKTNSFESKLRTVSLSPTNKKGAFYQGKGSPPSRKSQIVCPLHPFVFTGTDAACVICQSRRLLGNKVPWVTTEDPGTPKPIEIGPYRSSKSFSNNISGIDHSSSSSSSGGGGGGGSGGGCNNVVGHGDEGWGGDALDAFQQAASREEAAATSSYMKKSGEPRYNKQKQHGKLSEPTDAARTNKLLSVVVTRNKGRGGGDGESYNTRLSRKSPLANQARRAYLPGLKMPWEKKKHLPRSPQSAPMNASPSEEASGAAILLKKSISFSSSDEEEASSHLRRIGSFRVKSGRHEFTEGWKKLLSTIADL